MKRIDLTGKHFGEWEVLSYDGNKHWLCRCSCGRIASVPGSDLRDGKSLSCGHDTTAFKDLTGQHFGEWTVLEYSGKSYWKCKCSCGVIRNIHGNHLRTGRTKSCGHGKTGFASGLKSYSNDNINWVEKLQSVKIEPGSIIGEWEVLEYSGDQQWVCRCSCGKLGLVTTWALEHNRSKSCGHSKLQSLVGQHFGDWVVLEYTGNSYWKCQCSCGVIRNVRSNDLQLGKSKSCGHVNYKLKHDLTGEKFGKLTVIRYKGNGIYECQCDCGVTKDILSTNLLNGGTISCGCLHASKYTKSYLITLINTVTQIKNRLPLASDLADMTGLNIGYVNYLIKKFDLGYMIDRSKRSKYEIEIQEFIASLIGADSIRVCDRTVLNKYELDLYIPSKQLAIEFNGDYFHSTKFKDKKYHQNKTLECVKNGVHLIHIFEYEWVQEETKEKIKNILYGFLVNTKDIIWARKCYIAEVEKSEEVKFLNKYHLQNYAPSVKAYGLYRDTELLSIMTFGKPRFNQNFEWELIRYCTKTGISITGGAEKLFKHFIAENNPSSIVSYCDISKFTGSVYKKLGFKDTIGISEPNYKWIEYSKDGSGVILSRYQTQKDKLIEQGYEEYGDTETEIMVNRGFIKICDCGNLVLTWTK